MCQLFALTSSSPVSADFSLRGFFQRGGKTGEHKDGWGLALFSRGKADIQTHQSAAYNCQRASYLLETKPKATTVIAHIRKATEGHISPENTHPFVRELWGETWAFAHNGDLKNYYPENKSIYKTFGQTDSERAFCYLFNCLKSRFEHKPAIGILAEYIKMLSKEISQHGTFNFLLSNGTILLAHCTTELYWTQRAFPYGRLELLDTQLSIDLSELNDKKETMIVIATKPLTKGEAWYPMGRGEIRAFENGHLAYESKINTLFTKAPFDWGVAWQSSQVIIS